MGYYNNIDKDLIDKKIVKVFMSKDFLRFETEDGVKFTYEVEGDCCSSSVFYDFYGVKKLIENGKVMNVEEIDLDSEIKADDKDKKDFDTGEVKAYGYRITTHSDEFGDMSSVFSFRNYSNGYYGGSMNTSSYEGDIPEITDDVIEAKE